MYLVNIPTFILLIVRLERNNYSFSKQDKTLFWAITIGLRVFILFFEPLLSDDIFRYVWDGHIQQFGINPYLHNPDSATLIPYRTSWWTKVNNPNIGTPYPPFSEFIFFLFFANSLPLNQVIVIYRIGVIFFDIGTIKLVGKLLTLLHQPARRVIYYSWSPLVLLEFAGNGHNDVFALFFMMLALYYYLKNEEKSDRRYNYYVALALSLAILTKLYPIILLPFVIPRWRLKEIFVFITPFAVLSFIYYIPDRNVLSSPGLQLFVRYFEFNSTIFRIVKSITPGEDTGASTRIFYGVVMFLLSTYYIFQYHRQKDQIGPNLLLVNIGKIFFLSFIFGPDVQPWYILWVFPLAVIILYRPIIVYSLTIILSYYIYIKYDSSGIWEENEIVLLLEYLPVYLIWLHDELKQSTNSIQV